MKALFILGILLAGLLSAAQKAHDYKVTATYRIASPGGWDYLTVHDDRLYVSHGTQVNILNKATGDSVGVILNTPGVHGIAFNDALKTGYTSNGKSNNVTVFNSKTDAVITQISTGENPDAIMFEPFTKTVITCNGRSKNLSIIDPATNTIKTTIDVGGKPETAVSDGQGMLFVNIEDKNEIVAVDLKKAAVKAHWPLMVGEGPTGLSYDKTSASLFAGCDKGLVVMNALDGKIIAKQPIGEGCDGVAFDTRKMIIFTANGGDGTMTAIKVEKGDVYKVLGNYITKRGGRTLAIDEKTGTLFIPTAEYEEPSAGTSRPKVIPGTFQVLVVK